ncbi:MAG: hypothetical protein OEV30_05465 [Ignavibacteria bacterium]|nr:hypothetical protein [Ignavibacteria bacterium]
MKPRLHYALPFLVLLASCGTTTTTFTDTWKDPEAGKLDFKKVLTLVITDEDIIQRSAETKLAENITRAEAVPAHSFLTKEDLKDVEKAKAKVVERGFDGVVLMRIVAVDEQEQYVSGRYISDPSYGSWGTTGFWGYYGYYQPRVYEPGYTISKQVITIETKIFSIRENKMIWSGLSRTPQPSSVKGLVDDLATAAGKKLREEGLLD